MKNWKNGGMKYYLSCFTGIASCPRKAWSLAEHLNKCVAHLPLTLTDFSKPWYNWWWWFVSLGSRIGTRIFYGEMIFRSTCFLTANTATSRIVVGSFWNFNQSWHCSCAVGWSLLILTFMCWVGILLCNPTRHLNHLTDQEYIYSNCVEIRNTLIREYY